MATLIVVCFAGFGLFIHFHQDSLCREACGWVKNHADVVASYV